MRKCNQQISSWLLSEGFRIEKLEPLPGLKISWGFNVYTPPPLVVNVKVFQPQGQEDKVILLLGVNISPDHQRELSKLDDNERYKFMSKMLLDIIHLCPECKFVIQPNMLSPKAIIISRTLFCNDLTKSKLIDEVVRLVNVFIAINANLWMKFPHPPRKPPSPATYTI